MALIIKKALFNVFLVTHPNSCLYVKFFSKLLYEEILTRALFFSYYSYFKNKEKSVYSSSVILCAYFSYCLMAEEFTGSYYPPFITEQGFLTTPPPAGSVHLHTPCPPHHLSEPGANPAPARLSERPHPRLCLTWKSYGR